MSFEVTDEARLAERVRPPGSAAMFQRWEDLLFMHWRWEPAEIQRTLPNGLRVDTFGGTAWLGVVPFFMRGIRPAFFPAVPWLSNFLELNVRTYVTDAAGRPGVWFYSLDCNRMISVWTARTFFHLPYQHASMRGARSESNVHYFSRRRGAKEQSEFNYQRTAATGVAPPGSLEFFLVERYRLFASDRACVRSGRVHHHPYEISAAVVDSWSTDLFSLNGFAAPGRLPDHVVYSPGVSVEVYALGD